MPLSAESMAVVQALVAQNMPAAGSIAAANHIFKVAPRDGTVIGLMQRSVLLARLSNPAGVQYELGQFVWLGSCHHEHRLGASTETRIASFSSPHGRRLLSALSLRCAPAPSP